MYSDDCKNEIDYKMQLWGCFVNIYKKNLKGSYDLLDMIGLSNAQADILITLSFSGSISQNELASKLLVTKGNITQLLKKLEQAAFVKREKDWKTNYISLTEQGEIIVNEIKPIIEKHQSDFFSNLTLEQRKQLLELLNKI